jgi:hypothetical protein
MKVLDTSFESPTSSQPMKQGSMNLIQQAWQEVTTSLALNIIGKGYNPAKVYILYGCVNSGSGSNYIISAGAVFYAGEAYQVPAITFTAAGGQTAVGTIVTNFVVASNADPVVFTDGASHNVHQNRIITIASAVSGSGTADFANWLPIPADVSIIGDSTLAIAGVTTNSSNINALITREQVILSVLINITPTATGALGFVKIYNLPVPVTQAMFSSGFLYDNATASIIQPFLISTNDQSGNNGIYIKTGSLTSGHTYSMFGQIVYPII